MKTLKLLLFVMMVLAPLSVLAQSKGEMPFSGSPEDNRMLRKSWVALADFNHEEANNYTRQVLAKAPGMGMAYASLFSDNREEIKENLRKAEESKLSQDELLFIQGVQARFSNQSPQQYFEPLLKKYPKDLYLQLWILFNYNHLQRSIEIGEGIIKRNPKFAPAYNMLGYLYMDKRDMATAEAHFDKYISLHPKIANPYDSKADYFMRIGKIEDAIPLYEKALAMGMKQSAAKIERAKAMIMYPKLTGEDAGTIREMILASFKATQAGNVDELLRHYSDQSVEIFGNQVSNVGLPNIHKRVTGMFKNGSYSKQDFIMDSLSGTGPIAVAYGTTESIWKPASGKEAATKENVIFLLRRQMDGSWKILADHFYKSDSETLSVVDRKSISDLLHTWDITLTEGEVLAEKHFDAMTTLYSAQAIEIYPNQVSGVGIANLRARWNRFLGTKMETNRLGTIGVDGLGRRAVAWGIGSQNFYPKDSSELVKYQFPWAMILTKEKDDQWRILAYHWGVE